MKKIRKMISVCLIFCFLTGCQDKTQGTDQPEKKQRKDLVLWSYYETDAQKKSLDTLMESFNLSQEEYWASWEYVPMTEFTKRLSLGVMEGALPDLVLIDNPDMISYIELGIFEDLTDYEELWSDGDEYYKEVWNSVLFEGKYYGIPFCCNNLVLIYNRELLESARVKPPATWEDLMAAAKKLTGDNRYGFAMSCVEGEQAAFQLLPWILSTGEPAEKIGGEKTQEALSFLQEMVQNGYMDVNCVNWSQNDVARKFIAGEAAMIENGPWVLPMLAEAGIAYGAAPLPVKKESAVISGGENLCVIKDKDVEGAVNFLKFYKQGEIMKEICLQSCALPPKRDLALLMAKENPQFQVFADQMDTAKSRSGIKNWANLSKRLSEVSYKIITGAISPKEGAYLLRE